MIRVAIVILASAALAPAWVESVEFPWESYPRQLWERELRALAAHQPLKQWTRPGHLVATTGL